MSKHSIVQTLPSGYAFELIFVEGGVFDMGGSDREARGDEKPVHRVEVSSFYIGKYPVTQALWKDVMGPSQFEGDDRPVDRVSWNDTQEFIKKLNRQTEKSFRLPTEAEWEYAARGGMYSQGYLYAGSDRLKQVGWYDENSEKETKDVGRLLANELGLHDMSGNVWEWCQDWYGDDYYKECHRKGTVKNPTGPGTGASRVLRGGSCFHEARSCRPTYRGDLNPSLVFFNYGFRLVLPLFPL